MVERVECLERIGDALEVVDYILCRVGEIESSDLESRFGPGWAVVPFALSGQTLFRRVADKTIQGVSPIPGTDRGTASFGA